MSLPATPDMPRRELLFFTGMLVLIGAGWGLTQPLGKIAVSTGHRHFGLIFWQLVIGTVAFGAVSLAQRRRLHQRTCRAQRNRAVDVLLVLATR